MSTSEEELDLISNNTQIDNELYDDESYIVHPLLTVRRVALPQQGEDWEVLEDDKVVLVIKGVKLTKKQKAFLRTAEGLMTLINEYKIGNRSMYKIQKQLNSKIKKNL